MTYKCYYQEEPTRVGRKCIVSFYMHPHMKIQLIAYVGRARVNYFMYIENLPSVGLIRVTATSMAEDFPEPFKMLKASAGVRMYKGV